MHRSLARIIALAGLLVVFSVPAEIHAATKKKKPPVEDSDDSSTPARKTDDSDAPPPEKKTDQSDKPADKDDTETKSKPEHAPAATVEPEKITEFAAQPPRIQQLIRDAIDLTRQNLTYTFGSSDPASGGMDCSGTIYYLLKEHNVGEIPRDSSGQYLWARKSGAFFPVVSKSADSVEFKELEPGDLMFWTGTYESGRDVPISHVMMYLGHEKGTGKRIMFGSSDGRSYNGIQRWGVSVFDFKMPKADPADPEKAKADFVGFARIPGLRSEAPASPVTEQEPVETPKKTETPKKKAAVVDETKAVSSSDSATPAPKGAGSKSSRKKKKPTPDSD